MKLSVIAGIVAVAAIISGCASSHVLVGTARNPISPEQVKVYLELPAKYETIAMLEASDLGANGFSAQSRTNKIMKRLKAEAAGLGANGVLLSGIDTHTQVTGSVVNGTGYVAPQTSKIGKATAIYVPAE